MAEPNVWQKFLATVNREYERRVRAASLITAYGVDHHADHADADEAEAAVIVNIPRGAPRPQHPPASHADEA
jgi:hypothetical protein